MLLRCPRLGPAGRPIYFGRSTKRFCQRLAHFAQYSSSVPISSRLLCGWSAKHRRSKQTRRTVLCSLPKHFASYTVDDPIGGSFLMLSCTQPACVNAEFIPPSAADNDSAIIRNTNIGIIVSRRNKRLRGNCSDFVVFAMIDAN